MKNSEALRPSGLQPEQMFQTLQQMQHSASEVNKRTDLSAELRKIASDRGFLISDNQGSGDCMFYALSEQLDLVKRIQISHQELRQTVVQYLNKNPHMLDGTDLFNFVHGYQTWADYLTNMEQDGTWGDHVILYAAANCYQTCIHVISSLPHHSDLTIRPEHPIDSTNPLVLGHVHELHYVSLEPKQALAYQLESGNDHSSKSCDQGAAQVCRQGTSQAD
ncbi:OTU domain-containing protein DDB_G0284757-like [Oculina patagonica]